MQIFVEALEKDADQWVEAAEACLTLTPYVIGEVQKQQLVLRVNWAGVCSAVRHRDGVMHFRPEGRRHHFGRGAPHRMGGHPCLRDLDGA